MSAPKYYIHADGLSEGKVSQLIEFINNTDGEIVIGLNCGGGSNAVRSFVQQMFEENFDRLTLVALTGIYSAAFELFYNYTGRKVLTQGVCGMFHMATLECSFNANCKPNSDEERTIFHSLLMCGDSDRIFAASFMEESELLEYDEGKDVYMDFLRMQQIFPQAKIWK